MIIFDEAQAIKNIFADTTHAVRQLKALFKIALTGTPVENHLGEYFSIMDLVLPGLLGDYREFQGRAKADAASVLPALKERTRPFVLRRTKERILKELPPKIERDVYLELTEEQKKFYNRTVQEVRSTVDAAYRTKAAEQARIIALTAIMKLRQICLTPRLLVEELKEPAPKIEFLKEKLGELCERVPQLTRLLPVYLIPRPRGGGAPDERPAPFSPGRIDAGEQEEGDCRWVPGEHGRPPSSS